MGAMSAEQALEIAADHHRSGRLGPARAIYEQVLQQLPDQPVALHLLGLVNAQEGQIDQAVLLIRRAIEAWPNDVNFHANLAQILKNAGKIDAAADAYQNALALAPERSDLHFGLGNVRRLQARIPEAMAEYHETLRLDPSHAPALNNLGNCLLNAGNPGEALELLRRAVELNPDDYLALASLGTALRQLGRNPEAIACFRRAITLHPGDPRLHVIAGDALRDEKCFADAAAGYRAALALDGDRVDVHLNLALSLWDSDQLDAALDVCRKLLERWPGHVPAWTNLALMLLDSGQITEAIATLSKAVDLDPADAELHGKLIYMKFFDPRTTPHSSRNDLAEWNRRHGVRETTTPYHVLPTPRRRLRIGYVSPDFRQHVVGRNILPLLRNHDHSAFEIFCYSSNRAHDLLTDEFRRLADYFHVIAGESDEQAAARICDDRIDILVDLAVHTSGNRLGIFARKPAPVQATFAGYPGSTGLATIDYRITDPYLDPPRSPGRDLALYSERCARLSASFWCYDSFGIEPEVGELPALAAGHITFACLNSFYKINPDVLHVWARLMAAVPNSRLVLLALHGAHRRRTTHFLEAHGIAADRVRFHTRLPHADFLGLYRKIDIALDPFPHNGHATSLDCHFMGVPLVTLVGPTIMGRAGFSQLLNLHLPDLIAHSTEEYVRIATQLAADIRRLRELRSTLRARMRSSPLMDAPRFARDIENLYREMWQSWCAAQTSAGP